MANNAADTGGRIGAEGTTPGIAPQQDSLDPGQAGNAVAWSNVKGYGDVGVFALARLMRQAVQDDDILSKDALDERRAWSSIRQTALTRVLTGLVGGPMAAAAAEQMEGAAGDLASKIANLEALVQGLASGSQGMVGALSGNQQAAKVAQTTIPETGIFGQVVNALAVLDAQNATIVQQLASLTAAVTALVQTLSKVPTPPSSATPTPTR